MDLDWAHVVGAVQHIWGRLEVALRGIEGQWQMWVKPVQTFNQNRIIIFKKFMTQEIRLCVNFQFIFKRLEENIT